VYRDLIPQVAIARPRRPDAAPDAAAGGVRDARRRATLTRGERLLAGEAANKEGEAADAAPAGPEGHYVPAATRVTVAYTVEAETSALGGAGTDAHVFLELRGTLGWVGA